MPVLNNAAFFIVFGVHHSNELNNQSMTPLTWLSAAERTRAPTNQEVAAFRRMTNRGPMIHQGVIPSESPDFPTVANVRSGNVQHVTYTVVRYNSGRCHCFVFGLKFFSIRQCEEFIQAYNIAATRPRIRSLLLGKRNKVARRIQAQKVCIKEALETYYNLHSLHGITVRTLRRRGLVNKIEV